MLHRVVPTMKAQFTLELLPKNTDGTDLMKLGSKNGKVLLGGTGGVELASALGWYLNDYLNVTFDWSTYGKGQHPLFDPTPSESRALPLPLPETSILKSRQVPYSYYMNVCTYGYSLAFAPWSYWEMHIDWMAINGINMPLALAGQEWLWVQIFQEYGITFEEQASFFSGPAFLPWFRMGNVQGWGGPLTMDWIVKQKELKRNSLARMRGLGMKPVLGAFAGYVPEVFAERYLQPTTCLLCFS
jgi:alpha-N-acetylglucosaminidase